MAFNASTIGWWLVRPGRNDPTRESPWLGTAQVPSLHFVDAARATEQPDAFSAGRERFGPCSALLAGVVYSQQGWLAVNLLGVPALAAGLVVVVWLMLRRRRIAVPAA